MMQLIVTCCRKTFAENQIIWVSRLETGRRRSIESAVESERAALRLFGYTGHGRRSTRLAHLLQRIKHQTAVMHGYGVVVDLHDFKRSCVDCRGLRSGCSSSSNFSRRTDDGVTRSSFPTIKCMTASDEVMLAIKELNFLKKEYDIALETAKETQDTKKGAICLVTRQYVKSRAHELGAQKLRSINDPAEALVKWKTCYQSGASTSAGIAILCTRYGKSCACELS